MGSGEGKYKRKLRGRKKYKDDSKIFNSETLRVGPPLLKHSAKVY